MIGTPPVVRSQIWSRHHLLSVSRVQPLERVNGREDHAFHVFSWICDLNKLLNAEVFRDRAKETSVHVSIESLDRWEAAVSCVFNRRLMSLKLCRMSLKTGTTNVQPSDRLCGPRLVIQDSKIRKTEIREPLPSRENYTAWMVFGSLLM